MFSRRIHRHLPGRGVRSDRSAPRERPYHGGFASEYRLERWNVSKSNAEGMVPASRGSRTLSFSQRAAPRRLRPGHRLAARPGAEPLQVPLVEDGVDAIFDSSGLPQGLLR